MDKKSVMYAAGALVIILVLALVVKPMVTGQPLNTGLPVATTPQPTPSLTTVTGTHTTPVPQASPLTPLPSVIPTWDRNVMTIGFVDPINLWDNTRRSYAERDPVRPKSR